jgi:hypothetical protein
MLISQQPTFYNQGVVRVMVEETGVPEKTTDRFSELEI